MVSHIRRSPHVVAKRLSIGSVRPRVDFSLDPVGERGLARNLAQTFDMIDDRFNIAWIGEQRGINEGGSRGSDDLSRTCPRL